MGTLKALKEKLWWKNDDKFQPREGEVFHIGQCF